MYLEYCKGLVNQEPIESLPQKYLGLHLPILSQLYPVTDVLALLNKGTDLPDIASDYHRLISGSSAPNKHYLVGHAARFHGEKIIPLILGINGGTYKSSSLYNVHFWEEDNQYYWQLIKNQGAEYAWTWIEKDKFALVKTLLWHEEFKEFDGILDMATKLGKDCTETLLNSYFLTWALEHNAHEAAKHLVHVARRLGTKKRREYITDGIGNVELMERNTHYRQRFFLDTVEDIIASVNFGKVHADEVRLSALTAVIATELGNAYYFDKTRDTADPAKIIGKVLGKYPNLSNEQKGSIIAGNNFILAYILLKYGRFSYLIDNYIPDLQRLAPEKCKKLFENYYEVASQLIDNHKTAELKKFFEYIELAHPASPDKILEIILKDKAELLRRASKDNAPEITEYMLDKVYQQHGSEGLQKVFVKSRMFMAYDAGSLKVIEVLKKYAELTGDPSIRRQIVKNFRHNTFIGSKSSSRERRRYRNEEEVTKLHERMFQRMHEPPIPLLSADELRHHPLLLSHLEEYSRYKYDNALLNEILPEIYIATCLTGHDLWYEEGKIQLAQHPSNILQVAVFMATMFETRAQVEAYIDKHIVAADSIFGLAPAWCLPRGKGEWNVEGWRNLLMQDSKVTLNCLKSAIEIQEYLDAYDIPFPQKPEELENLSAGMHAAKLDVVIRRGDLREARTILAKYKLQSGFTFGLEQEFFGLKQSSIKPLKALMEMYDKDWRLKEDYGVCFDENVWVGYETNTPIISNLNLTDTLLVTWVLNNLHILVNSSCSFHAHIGIDINLEEEKRLPFLKQFTLNYLAIEDDLSFLDHSLISTYPDIFAKCSIGMEQAQTDIIEAKNVDELIIATRPDSKGHDDPTDLSRMRVKLNYHALKLHGTLEVRHHVGTNRFKDVASWLMFLDSLVAQTNQMLANDREPHVPDTGEAAKLKTLVGNYVKMRGDKKIVNDQDLPPYQRDLMEGRFRKTDMAQAV